MQYLGLAIMVVWGTVSWALPNKCVQLKGTWEGSCGQLKIQQTQSHDQGGCRTVGITWTNLNGSFTENYTPGRNQLQSESILNRVIVHNGMWTKDGNEFWTSRHYIHIGGTGLGGTIEEGYSRYRLENNKLFKTYRKLVRQSTALVNPDLSLDPPMEFKGTCVYSKVK